MSCFFYEVDEENLKGKVKTSQLSKINSTEMLWTSVCNLLIYQQIIFAVMLLNY